jgi:hypothetical protein
MVNKKDYDIKTGEIDGSYTLNGTKYWMRNTPFVKNKSSMRIYFSKEENKSSLTFKTLFYLREIKERLGSEFRKTFPRITIHQLAFSDAETILSTLWSQSLNKQTQPKTAKLIKELVKIKNKEDEECAPYLEQIRCVLESDSKAKKKKTPYGNKELNNISNKKTNIVPTLELLFKNLNNALNFIQEEEVFFYDSDYESPDMDRVSEAIKKRGESIEKFCKTPECKKYLANINEWKDLYDKKNELLKQLNSIKRQEKAALKRCIEFENSIAPEVPISQSKAIINSFINKK